MPQSLSALHVHIVFSTKDREPYLTGEYLERTHAYIARILQNLKCEQPVVGGVADHVHILCNLPRTITPADVVMVTKKDSSKAVKTFHSSLRDFHWQSGYALFSVSTENVSAARNYIQRQAQHRRGESFQDELRRMLKHAGIDYDEKYLWD